MIGLPCAADGRPLSIEVFPGNTRDPATFIARVDKVAKHFSVDHITFVGDRGMIGSRQIDDLTEPGFHFITAITKPQTKALIGRHPDAQGRPRHRRQARFSASTGTGIRTSSPVRREPAMRPVGAGLVVQTIT